MTHNKKFSGERSGTGADIPVTSQCTSRTVLCFCHSLL